MDLDFVWHLPQSYRDPKIFSQLSADAQIYVHCTHCPSEARIDISFASGDFSDARCRACGKNGMKLVRHLEKTTCHCRDCEKEFTTFTSPFITVRCPACDSNQLTVLTSTLEPPFPPTFHELLVAKENPWGISASEDSEFIVQSTQGLNFLPDFPLYFLADILFLQRLRSYGGYPKQHDRLHLLNLEGNLYRDYFRRTGELAAGVRAIPIFEQCAREEPDAVNRALMEHNVAMAIYSLLSRYEEDLVNAFAGRTSLRQSAITASERALAVFERLAAGDTSGTHIKSLSPDSMRMQCARIHHLIGDLLKVGDASEDDLRAAIDHLNAALALNVLDARLTAAVRESRAIAVVRLEKPDDSLIKQAIQDLEFAVNRGEEGRAWSDKMASLSNLSRLYSLRQHFDKAIGYAERAVSIALREIDQVIDEQILKQKASQYAELFEQLASLYAATRQPEKALAALEAFRAGTIRIHTMSEAEKQAHDQRAAEDMIKTQMGRLFGNEPDTVKERSLKLEPVLPRIQPLRHHLGPESALVSLAVKGGTVTALVLTCKSLLRSGLQSHQWRIMPNQLKTVGGYLDLEPGPMREQRLQRICDECWSAFLQPLESLLAGKGVTSIGLAASGLIGQLPFEGFRSADPTAAAAASPLAFFYLPSFQVGSDLAARNKSEGNGKMLIVGYADTDLPSTVEEVTALRSLYKDRVVVLDTTSSSKRSVLEALQQPCSYIHFTCHGSFDPVVPLNSALHLVRNPENDSHRITARELLEVHVPDFPVVTMSACSTALVAVDVSNGNAGLVGSLLRAGARCVIGTRWDVYDDTAAAFMRGLYSRVVAGNAGPFEAFVATQRDTAKTGGLEDWAAFAYVGLP